MNPEKHYAFVSFVAKEDAETAKRLGDGVNIDGRALRVNWGKQHQTQVQPEVQVSHQQSQNEQNKQHDQHDQHEQHEQHQQQEQFKQESGQEQENHQEQTESLVDTKL